MSKDISKVDVYRGHIGSDQTGVVRISIISASEKVWVELMIRGKL